MALCIKTGACVRIIEYDTYLVCDLYEMSMPDCLDAVVIAYAISQPQYEPPRPVTHEMKIGFGWFKNHNGSETTIMAPARNVREV
jgi:hypothetical protein